MTLFDALRWNGWRDGPMSQYIPHIFFDPHELVSRVNKVRKLDNDALPTFRFSLVLAA
ncbi:hypothetical protein Pla100_12020 [Neorhodopirellula pilleata]|uniref:Uncharacterized protein n=1 Tax=Neorhodopirellula pilleata TaxID=2714738 RepID=A0A5C6APM0_9BACT|nr:hypothetical protein Pla100_12020 [Neorhodopirellula pilleata]